MNLLGQYQNGNYTVSIFDDGTKVRKNELDFFDYSNIKGRSGRMMEHYVGKVYNFINIPKEEKIVVDIPFYEQNKELITDEILVNIPEKDKEKVAKKLSELFELDYEKTLKKVRKRSSIETIAKRVEKEKRTRVKEWKSKNVEE